MPTTTLPPRIIRKWFFIIREKVFGFDFNSIFGFFIRYLIEDQVKGPSSVEGYERALLSGCRCVKVDVHDGRDREGGGGGGGGDHHLGPLVYNGNTLTSRIPFADVLTSIKEHAFTASP